MREGIYRKTDAGRDEISNRGRRLSPPLRTVLLMVDGQRSLADLREVMAGMKAPDDALEALLADGLIELVPSGFDVAGLMGAVAPRPASQPPNVVMAETARPSGDKAGGEVQSALYLLLYGKMSEAVRAHLGLRGYFLQLKVERCTDAEGLQALLPELRAALAKAKGENFAADWERALETTA